MQVKLTLQISLTSGTVGQVRKVRQARRGEGRRTGQTSQRSKESMVRKTSETSNNYLFKLRINKTSFKTKAKCNCEIMMISC